MTVRCMVRGCKSGTYADKQEKIRAGVKPPTVFTAPKSMILLEKWSTALNQLITVKDKVCELHFADTDIVKSDDTLMPDGSVFSLPRQKYTLRKNAVPIGFGNEENKVPSEKEKIVDSKTIKYNNQEMMNVDKVDVKKIEEMEKDYFSDSDKEDFSSNISQSESDEKMLMDVTKQNSMKSSLLNDHQYFIDNNKPQQYYYYNKEASAYIAIPSLDNNVDKVGNEQLKESSHSDNTDPDSFNDKLPDLSIKSILNYLQIQPLQRGWSWMNFTKKDSGITFTHVDCMTRTIRCFVQLHEDMSVTIQTGDEQLTIEVNFEIQSNECILKMLDTVTKMKICSGSGLEKRSRHENCSGILAPNEEYKISMQCFRCIACRKLRKIINNRATQSKADLHIKYELAKKELVNLRRRCKRYEEKLSLKDKRLEGITEMIKTINRYNKA